MDNEANNTPAQASDKSFYLIMLALIVGMGFYISYDMEQRYGSVNKAESSTVAEDSTAAVENQPAHVSGSLAPIIVGIEKVQSVEVKPVAEIPATETSPEAVVEKTVQEATVTTAVVAVENAPVEETKAEPSVVIAGPAAVQLPAVTEAVPVVTTTAESQEVTGVVVEDMVEEKVEQATVSAESIPATQPAQGYNPYDYPYGRSYGSNSYPPQRPYNNPNRRSYRGNYYPQQRPYGNPYSSNPYSNNRYRNNPYGYDYNPYQQPAASTE